MWELDGLEVSAVFVFVVNEAFQSKHQDSTRTTTFCPHTCWCSPVHREPNKAKFSILLLSKLLLSSSFQGQNVEKRQKSVFAWFYFLTSESSHPHLFLRLLLPVHCYHPIDQIQWFSPLPLAFPFPWLFLFSFFLFFFYCHTFSICKFLGQELNLRCTCNLCHSCGNPDSLAYCARLRINPCLHSNPSCCSWILKPLHHSGNSSLALIFKVSVSAHQPLRMWFLLIWVRFL